MKPLSKLLLAIGLFSASTVHAATEVKTMFGGVDLWQDTLLRSALDASGKDYTVSKLDNSGLGERAVRALEAGQSDVIWTMTSPEMEERLIPIRIPLFKGLLGNRLPIIKKADQGKFASLDENQFRQLKVGQVESWPDAKILANDGLPVVTSIEYALLYGMLNAQRFDYFTLGAAEIEGEFNRLGPDGQMIDNNILIQYHSPAYFFVSPTKPELAADITAGLEKLVANGQFDEMFYNLSIFKDLHQRLKLDKRTVFYINNNSLTAETPCQRPELWDSLFATQCNQ
ncbi:pilus assembly protein PilM [Photobacterium sanctipauli]|uniref:Pilus assembly protein PilM n=1 Tax=Photobacterium sanctipauli TaxID=1342794 RepID=A0A2T3NGQ6_9GAMM|nr:hypothetical protein [Photobacterium sanctipauli]PSW13937.1 pilus assembly protein PilM [Photobacterium sanctipauli]